MKNSGENYYNPAFSHIYVERAVMEHPRTQQILSRFPKAQVIEIDHYKDVFCRRGQDYGKQHRAQSLIIAAKQGTLLYPGAPVCQSFGNPYFYYTSCVMNCIYDCEYCYLKGMYPSANLVIFVNLEDIFTEVQKVLAQHDVYLCVSYDTDLFALEEITGYAEEWVRFVNECGSKEQKGGHSLRIELRTKCANRRFFEMAEPSDRIVYAFTLSPQEIITLYEHYTPSLSQRIAAAAEAQARGCMVRLCFDPMIYHASWRQYYENMLAEVMAEINWDRLLDVSVGSFRVSQDYLKKMRKNAPDSAVVQFPYENDGGVYHYGKALTQEMEGFLVEQLLRYLPKEKIFLWEKEET